MKALTGRPAMLADAAISVVKPPLVAELSAVVAGALVGALFARQRGLDLIGILGIAVATGLGGGMIRDVLLGKTPLALLDEKYLWTVLIAAVAGALFASVVTRLSWILLVVDTLALGMFTSIGAQRGLAFDLPFVSAVFLGSVTGIGGTVVRDLFAGDLPPQAFRRGTPYASLAVLGAILYCALGRGLDIDRLLVELAVVLVVAGLRFLAIWRGWRTPKPTDITPRFLRHPGSEGEEGAPGSGRRSRETRGT